MHCPDCGKKYPEGSQRFCDADGTRLISVSDDDHRRGQQRVFTNILPVAVKKTNDEALNEKDFGVVSESETAMPADLEGFFVDPDESIEDSTQISEGEFEIIDEPEPIRIAPRKIDPREASVGRAGLGYEQGLPQNTGEFSPDDPDAFVGRLVKGRYKVDESIGSEESVYTFLAEDKIVPGKRVIVRILTEHGADAELREERISLSHMTLPNVVRLIDSGEFVDGTEYLVSEYCEALTVNDLLRIHGPLPASRAAKIIRQASYVLTDVHNQRVLHRDLRPEALLVTGIEKGSEQIKISSFGVSDGSPKIGTLSYKAPEILRGGKASVAGDIYALGVIAYRVLTGKMPFQGDSVTEMLSSQNSRLKLRPADVRSDIPAAFDAIFEKVLSVDPADRYQTARDFGDALFNSLAVHPVIAPTATRASSASGSVNLADVEKARSEDISEPKRAADADPFETRVDPIWTKRSPEPPTEPGSKWIRAIAGTIVGVLIIAAAIWYFAIRLSNEAGSGGEQKAAVANANVPDNNSEGNVPPSGRTIQPPSNTIAFENKQTGLKGDLYRNFIGFSLYYPKDWKFIGPQASTDGKTRGKFLDISRMTQDGRLAEQMLVSYYPSNGTFNDDSVKFSEMVSETNETLRQLIPNYQMVSEGATRLNDGWRAYEIRFQGSGTDAAGEKLEVWGRRLFVPVARPGVRAGYSITMLATSNSAEDHSVDDVGNNDQLAKILETFEPSRNF